MAQREHLLTLKKGSEFWNLWREKQLISGWNTFVADLSGADLTGQDLSKANLKSVDLSGARLKWADLRSADLSSANLKGTDFDGATVGATVFCDVDLSGAKGLETMRHLTPSMIGVETIFRSQGNIPRKFLIDAGVPETLITYIPSIVGTGVEFYSLFLSYSSHDQEFAEQLHANLQAKGVRCWFAPEDVKGGLKLHEQIDEAIRYHDKLLLILSEHSMNSEWVKTEIAKARKRELRDGRRILFPIRLCSFEELMDWECFDADTGKDSAKEIREFFIPGFEDWKNHDAYSKAFERLLSDLRGQKTGD